MLKSPLLKKYCGGPKKVSQGPACWKTHERVDGTTKGAKGSCQHKNPNKRPK
mgnify:FL=1|jgi:hypothetical protein|tara:strand:+ start:611 stop:766 length:156 start_codon:yes stop_codon:yes gene_type:complete